MAVALVVTPPLLVAERLTSKPGPVRCQVPNRGAPSTTALAGSVVLAGVFTRRRTSTWASPVVMRAKVKQTRKGRDTPEDGTSWRSQIGHVTRIGPEGRSRLHPGAKHPSPIASAGKVGLPSAPSAHRDGYADPKDRGPRFSTLPPPPDKPYTPHYGALQPALRSRLDNTQDIRLEGSMGEVLPETADTICFVPEPYVRAQRPDQRVRSTAALSDSEAISDTLEKAGIWFRPVPTREEHFREMSDDELRERLRDVAELVSGSRRDLLKRLYSKKSNFTSWTKAEVETECYRLGLEVLEKKADNVVNIKNAQEWQQIRNLSDEDLAYELSYRGLDSEDRKSDEETLRAYLDGRMF